jgi:hypothetical protein
MADHSLKIENCAEALTTGWAERRLGGDQHAGVGRPLGDAPELRGRID